MKKLLLILGLFPVLVLVIFFALSLLTRGQAAAGIVDGKLTPCPDSPNCVCSEFPNDTAHYIAPIPLPEGAGLDEMKIVIEELGGEVQRSEGDYLAATFTSDFFRFTDDVEIRLDAAASLMHVRSAARAGYGDMGVNQVRVEEIRSAFGEMIQIQ